MFILTTVVLFLVADHLFKGNKRRERISTFYSDPGQIISHPSTDTHSKEGYSAKDFEDMSNMKWPHQFRHTSDGDVTGVKGLRDQYGNSRNANTLLACGDALCTKYLSRSDMSALFQCQRNATKKMKRLAQSGNDTQSPLLVSLHRDYSTGALSSGKCRFMEGTGKKATKLTYGMCMGEEDGIPMKSRPSVSYGRTGGVEEFREDIIFVIMSPPQRKGHWVTT